MSLFCLQDWANKLARDGCQLVHSRSGENLAAMYSSAPISASCVRATNAWYNEVSQYRFSFNPWTTNKPNFKNIGHFTQLVWVNSRRIGCAGAVGSSRQWRYCTVEVCHYSAAGNVVTDAQFRSNVLPRRSRKL